MRLERKQAECLACRNCLRLLWAPLSYISGDIIEWANTGAPHSRSSRVLHQSGYITKTQHIDVSNLHTFACSSLAQNAVSLTEKGVA